MSIGNQWLNSPLLSIIFWSSNVHLKLIGQLVASVALVQLVAGNLSFSFGHLNYEKINT